MTPDDFRLLAVGLPQTRFNTALGNMTFVVSGKTFATLGSPDPAWATIKLNPADQAKAMTSSTGVFSPQPGGAGVRGWTCIRLAHTSAELVEPWLKAAHRSAATARSVRTVLST